MVSSFQWQKKGVFARCTFCRKLVVVIVSLTKSYSPMADSLDSLFRQYKRELNRIAYSRLGCPDDADDVVQDAFVRYATQEKKQNQGMATEVETPKFFLFRIVSNLVIDRIRQQQRRGIHTSIDEVGQNLIDPRPLLCEQLASRQQLKRLAKALDELPENCRAAILMSRLDGLSHAEIAERLQVSKSMVSKYIMQAVKHCAKRLDFS